MKPVKCPRCKAKVLFLVVPDVCPQCSLEMVELTPDHWLYEAAAHYCGVRWNRRNIVPRESTRVEQGVRQCIAIIQEGLPLTNAQVAERVGCTRDTAKVWLRKASKACGIKWDGRELERLRQAEVKTDRIKRLKVMLRNDPQLRRRTVEAALRCSPSTAQKLLSEVRQDMDRNSDYANA